MTRHPPAQNIPDEFRYNLLEHMILTRLFSRNARLGTGDFVGSRLAERSVFRQRSEQLWHTDCRLASDLLISKHCKQGTNSVERIRYQNPEIALPGVQVFGPQPFTAGTLCGGDNHAVPKM